MENINDSFIIDVIKEVGNIGAGNAATSLATIMSKKVNMNVPCVKILEFDQVASILGGEENLVVGIYLGFNKDIVGNMMLAFELESALNLCEALYKKEDRQGVLDDMDFSLLSEVGNIVASSYANSLSQLTGLKINLSVPSLALDMAGAILSVPAIQYGLISDKVIMIETIFKEDEMLISGNFFLLPDLKSFDKILEALGVL